MFTRKDNSEIKSPGPAVLMFYFSAHWCPPCRKLTPLLVEFYQALRNENIDSSEFDVVFISSDRSQEQFDDYYDEMPWAHLKLDDSDEKMRLSRLFSIATLPSLIAVNSGGSRIDVNARKLITDWALEDPSVRGPAATILAAIIAASAK